MNVGDYVRILPNAPCIEGTFKIKRIIDKVHVANGQVFSDIVVLDGVTIHKFTDNMKEYIERCESIGIDHSKESGIGKCFLKLDIKTIRKQKLNKIF